MKKKIKVVYVIRYSSGHIKCVCEDFEKAKKYMKDGYESISTILEQGVEVDE